MALRIRMSGTHHYRGRAVSFRNTKTFEDVAHARAYVKKVTTNAREQKRTARRGRNASRLITFISVWPDEVKIGDVVDVWSHQRGWHKGEVYEHPRFLAEPELRTRSLPEER